MKKILCVLLFMTVALTGCKTSDANKIILADQFGLAYAPIEIMKQKGFLEKALMDMGQGDTEIEWVKMANTSAIREAMVSGALDIGFVGIPPFILGKDNGMDWRIISGVSESPVGLVTKDNSLLHLSDLTERHRIILPQPGSIQHILLMMGLENEGLDPKTLDKQLVAMSHPDGRLAFKTGGKEQLHLTTPPFLNEALTDSDTKELLTGEEAFGGAFTFIVAICEPQFFERSSHYKAFQVALSEAIDFMNNHPDEALKILIDAYDYDPALIETVLRHPQMRFSNAINGLEKFCDFMYDNQVVKSQHSSDELIWGNQ